MVFAIYGVVQVDQVPCCGFLPYPVGTCASLASPSGFIDHFEIMRDIIKIAGTNLKIQELLLVFVSTISMFLRHLESSF